MKIVKSKLLQKSTGNKRGKYLLTLELSDYDIEIFEELGGLPTSLIMHGEPLKENIKLKKYFCNLFHNIFQRMWRQYDDL